MAEQLRIALVAEGPTDMIVIRAALEAILRDRPFVMTLLQPEVSAALDGFGPFGGGWTGVYRWCKQAASRGGGRLSSDALSYQNFDFLVIHLDADVAGEEYASGNIRSEACDGNLPCLHACPPASATTNALREVLLTWCGETRVPGETVVCMPSMSSEAWILAALFPDDRAMKRDIECYPDPESRLGQQPKKSRVKKTQSDYSSRAHDLTARWPAIARQGALDEAWRFQREFVAALPSP